MKKHPLSIIVNFKFILIKKKGCCLELFLKIGVFSKYYYKMDEKWKYPKYFNAGNHRHDSSQDEELK